ncbi:MAG: DUF1349 domain-containing protein [Trueperaceae bacterium]|nr:DUF1349 domain-containing protein [Trueperaceae bacterium]
MPLINALPYELSWQREPLSWSLEPLTLMAAAKTDLFVSPEGQAPVLNAPALLFEAPAEFMLSCQVQVDFRATFDAGVLFLYQSETSWAKLCFEYSPQQDPMIVSVVTKGSSDDCNSLFIKGQTTYLRVSGLGKAFAFHHSLDGKYWHFIRTFALGSGPVRAGFVAQSPMGEGCEVQFSDIVFKEAHLSDLRSGV